RLGLSFFPLGELLLVLRHCLRGFLFDLLPALDQGAILRVFLEQLAADPGLAGRPPPRVVDQPDGDPKRLAELPAEEVPDGREVPGRVRRADIPAPLEIFLRLL